ncbi:hypothetical protein [Gimesia fumaroli]|uniref:Uncharacterized protein n=1 Tax=Gimesia fumaroli TaxID=2527976 RepID=A0A518IAE7_9PLAN|nr:hypothetical protein [Gimesia fumaroli]QDV50087.1 hypothetical protein Enr17x_21230 [Gimesia fumaroli]
MAIYDSTDQELSDYITGKATGCAYNAYSSLGVDHRNQANQWGGTNYTGGNSSKGSAGPGVFDDVFNAAGDFANEWTETIVELISSVFRWVPERTGLALRLMGIMAFLIGGVSYELGGWSLLAVTATGWFAPRIAAGLMQITLYLILSVLYLCFMLILVIACGGLFLGGLYVLNALFNA